MMKITDCLKKSLISIGEKFILMAIGGFSEMQYSQTGGQRIYQVDLQSLTGLETV
jgi:hypothetical protein